MLINRKKASLLASTVIFGSLVATPVYAQDEGASEDNGTILVTGTRIARQNVDTAAPIAVVDSEEFSLSGTVNVENVVNQLPQVIPGFTSNSNNPGTGTSTLNLRGLGSARTMVLVNGRRWMFYDTAQIVDLNTIPQFLLDGVDVVTGGASAVYGSDAMSGVVNFRLRHVDGVEVGGQYSVTDRGDGDRYQIHGAIGTEFADGRGRATVFGEYYNRSSVFQGDRDFSFFALGGETFGLNLLQFGSSTVPQGRFNAPGSTTVDGVSYPLASGLTIDDALFDTPGVARARAGDTYNYAPVNYLQIPQERYLIGGYAEYEIFDGVEAYTEVSFVNNRVAQELAATPVTGTFNIDLDTVQPFFDAATFAQLQTLDQREEDVNAARIAAGLAPNQAGPGVVRAFIQRRMLETGPRNSLDERNAFRVLAGLRGDLGQYINWDAYYMYARTRNANVQSGNISRSAFQAGLDGTGTAINPFGAGTLTDAMVNAVTIQAQNGDISTLEVLTGYLSGTFGDFAIGNAAPIGFALGGEYRRVASRFIPDTALSSGDVIGFNAGSPTDGAYNVHEIFGELQIPIIETDSGLTLDVNGAARYSDYSLTNVGGVWAYAGGIEFSPIPDIKFRGQYQRAVRAPNVGELFGGQAIGFPGATDPCGNATFLAANPGADAICVATGVPQANLGNAAVVQLNAQIPALFGGNPGLQEETSDSWTFGVVLQPEAIPGLTITADYFDIVIEDTISIAGGSLQGLFDLCYGDIQDVNNAACQPFVGIRNSDGAITVNAPPLVSSVNIAELGVSGIDLQVNYGMDLPFSVFTSGGVSDFNISFLGTWTESSYFVPIAALPRTIECAGEFANECGEPTPSFKWTSRFTWVDGPFTFSTRWRHLSAVDDDDVSTDYTQFNGIERIDAYDLIDLTMSYDWNDMITLSVGVRNLFDTLPGAPEFDANGFVTNRPNSLLLGDNQEQANTYPSTYDVLGRDWFASVLFRF
ncbi:TonB-dependent receptor [Aurantiacibacter sp. MUD11]|uniref:TonB-dependent receptor plug domain-containing protein n=1 Tax=Aurantiacibacter sp. MUD11 TaxID=3003265 RepID=UPI0022AB4664|nr:TonB-dependent receptor [Aurantiacibacter sp. MUD11]WAT18128.1 TonB-dependent receptor [Aurantiacibacter sp. MUD11]